MASALNIFLAGCTAYPAALLAHGGRYDAAALVGLFAVGNLVAAWIGRGRK